jgi:hypothetical protein
MKICKKNPLNQSKTVTISCEEYNALKSNHTINITNNITIFNNFRSENFEHLSKYFEFYWAGKSEGLLEMIKDIHFDSPLGLEAKPVPQISRKSYYNNYK